MKKMIFRLAFLAFAARGIKVRMRLARTYLGAVIQLRKIYIHFFVLVSVFSVGMLGFMMFLAGLVSIMPFAENHQVAIMIGTGLILAVGALVTCMYMLSENYWSNMLGTDEWLEKILGPGHQIE